MHLSLQDRRKAFLLFFIALLIAVIGVNLFFPPDFTEGSNSALSQAETNGVSSEYLSRKHYYFISGQWINYTWIVLKLVAQPINVVGAISAFLVTTIWFWYLETISVFEKVKFFQALIVFVLGVVFSLFVVVLNDANSAFVGIRRLPGFWGQLKYSALVTGITEEFVKLLPVLFLVLLGGLRDSFKIVFFACISALGFAFAENLLYFDSRIGSGIIHGRALTSVLGHMILSTIAAYGILVALHKHKSWWRMLISLPVSFLIAATLHGLFNTLLYLDLYVIFIFYFFLLTLIWLILINNALNNSLSFKHPINFNYARVQSILILLLGGVLLFEYVVAGLKSGSEKANIALLASFINGSIFMVFFASNLGKIDIVRNHWKSVGIKLPDWDGTDSFTDFLKLLNTPFSSNTISPQNYVGKVFSLRASVFNKELKEVMPEQIECKFVDRIVLWSRDSKGKAKPDPDWFLAIVLNQNKESNRSFLVKFVSEATAKVESYVEVMAIRKSDTESQEKWFSEDHQHLGKGLARERQALD